MSDPVDDLYQRVPGEFVAARNQLVRELKKAGEKDRAAEVAKLRRPSVGAWAVNQLARRDRAELEELLRTGAQLREAQDEALAGGDPDALREAARARRDAVARLVDRAVSILDEHGSGGEAHRAEIAATLDAASLDEHLGEEVGRGRLTSELEAPSGFAPEAMLFAEATGDNEAAQARAARRDAHERARRQAQERHAEAERAEARAVAARRRLEKVTAEVEAAERSLSAAKRRARQAADEVAETQQAAEDARRKATGAAGVADG